MTRKVAEHLQQHSTKPCKIIYRTKKRDCAVVFAIISDALHAMYEIGLAEDGGSCSNDPERQELRHTSVSYSRDGAGIIVA